ncbi:helix-turn-helix domain-containing protein [Enterococcus xiangfangensis]|uniref:helix-turn-helix domain-containing protein n=1 Tax=Enterococcus xiangfangensis TaxID=1296537 RepID=UPI0010F9C0F1|nr:AraC family transcriptional regulator [Enterococcus xiangfangensis]MBM7711155.1 AraC-like DNA-binding protein [Enterococcus xiangfangensis]
MEQNSYYISVLPIKRIYGLDIITLKKNNTYQINSTPQFIFYYVEAGNVKLITNEQELFLQGGESIILSNKASFEFINDTCDSTSMIAVTFNIFTEDTAIQPVIKQKTRLSENQKNLIKDIVLKAQALYEPLSIECFDMQSLNQQADPFDERILYLHFAELLYTIVQNYQRNLICDKKMYRKNNKQDVVSEILKFMEEHLDKNYSVEELANLFFISPSYIKKIFKEHTGYSIINYYKTLKMEQAKDLIQKEDMSFTDIGLSLGYDSIHHFSNTFKKYTGLSPSKYKQSINIVRQKINYFS